jgi:hypothetical protein
MAMDRKAYYYTAQYFDPGLPGGEALVVRQNSTVYVAKICMDMSMYPGRSEICHQDQGRRMNDEEEASARRRLKIGAVCVWVPGGWGTGEKKGQDLGAKVPTPPPSLINSVGAAAAAVDGGE